MKLFGLFLGMVISVSACSSTLKPEQEQEKPFHIISEASLQKDMQAMAESVKAIAFICLDDKLTLKQKQSHVLPLLDSIGSIASEIDSNGAITNYSVVNRFMGAFLYDVSIARDFALRDPPNFFPAQSLVKSCLSCHESI